MKDEIIRLMEEAIANIIVAVEMAEEHGVTDEQWFLNLETQIGELACQDHAKNITMINE